MNNPGPWHTMSAGIYGVPVDPVASARLCAAAPDLLAALERAEQMLSDWQHTLSARGARVDPLLNEARAAIARAKGGV